MSKEQVIMRYLDCCLQNFGSAFCGHFHFQHLTMSRFDLAEMMRKADEYIWNYNEHALVANTYDHRLDETSALPSFASQKRGQHAVNDNDWEETKDEKPSARDVPETPHSHWPAELTEPGTALLLRRVPEGLSFRQGSKPPNTFSRAPRNPHRASDNGISLCHTLLAQYR